MKMSYARACCVVLISTSMVGCGGGGDGGGGVINPPLDVSGQWTITDTPTSNTCHPLDPPDTQDYLFTVNGNQVSSQPEGDTCGPVALGALAGDTLTINYTLTDSYGGPGQCVVRHAFTGTIRFTTNTLSGNGSDSITRVSGDCSYAYPTLPCHRESGATGTRCSGCYGGCVQQSAAQQHQAFHRRMPSVFSPR